MTVRKSKVADIVRIDHSQSPTLELRIDDYVTTDRIGSEKCNSARKRTERCIKVLSMDGSDTRCIKCIILCTKMKVTLAQMPKAYADRGIALTLNIN